MDESKYDVAFELISYAGDAKSAAMMAVDEAREGNFEQAQKYLDEAEEKMREAHSAQIKIIEQETQGNPVDVNVIMVHAQDHITMAMMARDNAEEFINLYKLIAELKK